MNTVNVFITSKTNVNLIADSENIKFSTMGVIYGLSCIILVTLVAVFVFREKLSLLETLGIMLGISSLIILYRFS